MTTLHAALSAYCLAKPGAWRDEPWPGSVVAKVGGRVFAFLGPVEGSTTLGLKCAAKADDLDAREWRDQYPDDVTVMAYIGRHGWNTFVAGGAVPDDELREAIDRSYDAVVARLPRAVRPS